MKDCNARTYSVRIPKTTPSAPASLKASTSLFITSNSKSEYRKSPPLGRIMTYTGILECCLMILSIPDEKTGRHKSKWEMRHFARFVTEQQCLPLSRTNWRCCASFQQVAAQLHAFCSCEQNEHGCYFRQNSSTTEANSHLPSKQECQMAWMTGKICPAVLLRTTEHLTLQKLTNCFLFLNDLLLTVLIQLAHAYKTKK